MLKKENPPMLPRAMKINTELINYNEFTTTDECIFCKPPELELLTETANFYVTFDASPLIEGHVDIHTKEHIGCAAEIDPSVYEEFIALKRWVATIIKKQYGTVSFYEHGRAGHCGMTVDGVICHHFHLHALPFKEDISKEVSEISDPIIIKDESEISVLYEEYDQYLYFENKDGTKYFFPVSGELPSHYLRTVIANTVGRPQRANWEQEFDKDTINQFKMKLTALYNE